MKVFNDKICLESFEDGIKVNGVQICGDRSFVIKKIKDVTKGIEVFNIDKVNFNLSYNEVVLMLGIAYNVETLHSVDDNDNYEITFSYHFPLFFEKKFIEILIENFDLIVYGNVVNLATKGEFVRANLSNGNEYKSFYDNHGYWMRHNDKLIEIKNSNLKLNETIDNWNLYCKKKFNKEFSTKSIEVYKKIYSLLGFYVLEHICQNNIVAQGVIYISEQTKTLYYCIFWWDNKFKSLSPGKYNYAKLIEYCHNNNLAFSFCYGFQKYKFELIKFFKNSNNQEWARVC